LVGDPDVLLVNGLLLLFMWQQDVSAFVAWTTFEAGLGLLLIVVTMFDVLAGKWPSVLRLSQLLARLGHGHVLVLGHRPRHFAEVMRMDLARVLTLYHHFLIE
jgi:hypothetical protein